jgi:hypothetical protein
VGIYYRESLRNRAQNDDKIFPRLGLSRVAGPSEHDDKRSRSSKDMVLLVTNSCLSSLIPGGCNILLFPCQIVSNALLSKLNSYAQKKLLGSSESIPS